MSSFYGASKRYRPYDYKSNLRRNITRFFLVIFLVFIFFQLVDHFLLQAYAIKNSTMFPSLSVNDRILSTPLLYGPRIPFSRSFIAGFTVPKRGDIVVCRPGYYTPPPVVITLLDKTLRFFTLQKISIITSFYYPDSVSYTVKRIVGLPGDTVKMSDYVMYIKPKGKNFFFHESELASDLYEIQFEPLPEDWTMELPFSSSFKELTLREDEYFVIGDNRNGSLDSRHWGVIRKSDILGKMILKYWPFREFSLF